MSITVAWHNPEKNTILLTFDLSWNWKEFKPIKTQILKMLDDRKERLDLIVDVSQNRYGQGSAILLLIEMFVTPPAHLGLIVIVGAIPLMRNLFGAAQSYPSPDYRVVAGKVRFVPTLEEVQSILSAARQ